MQFRVFTLPIHDAGEAADALNGFLNAHRILSVDRGLIQDGSNSVWSICVTYEPATAAETRSQGTPKRNRVDYREILNDEEFAVFLKLRAVRKDIADKEGIPPYGVFTNDQLAELIRRRVESKQSLQEIAGIGSARIDKYAEAVLPILCDRAAAPALPPAAADGADAP